jgi:magnesium transporter
LRGLDCFSAVTELAQVRDTSGLHELAVEHVQNAHIRPKIELNDQGGAAGHPRTARYDDAAGEAEFGELSVFLAPAFVITVRQGVASEPPCRQNHQTRRSEAKPL